MKSLFALISKAVACVALIAGTSVSIMSQSPVPRINGGVGPAVAGSTDVSTLPQQALNFVGTTFPGEEIVECERNFDNGTFEVELADGTDIEFDADGNWTEIDGGAVNNLPQAVLQAVLPAKAYRDIVNHNKIDEVETVKRGPKGYQVEMRQVEYATVNFTTEGKIRH